MRYSLALLSYFILKLISIGCSGALLLSLVFEMEIKYIDDDDLGGNISQHASCDKDVDRRIALAAGIMRSLHAYIRYVKPRTLPSQRKFCFTKH